MPPNLFSSVASVIASVFFLLFWEFPLWNLSSSILYNTSFPFALSSFCSAAHSSTTLPFPSLYPPSVLQHHPLQHFLSLRSILLLFCSMDLFRICRRLMHQKRITFFFLFWDRVLFMCGCDLHPLIQIWGRGGLCILFWHSVDVHNRRICVGTIHGLCSHCSKTHTMLCHCSSNRTYLQIGF